MFGVMLLAGLAFGGVQAQDAPPDPTADGVSITVYNQGTALVRDRRTFTLTQG